MGFRRPIIHKPFRSSTRKPPNRPKCCYFNEHQMSGTPAEPPTHKVLPVQTWRMERHLHYPQSQSSATLHAKTQEPVPPNTICYRGGQHLFECWSTITENSKQAPFIVGLASASWQSWQPTACSLLMKTQGCSGSLTSVSPSTCSGVTACLVLRFASRGSVKLSAKMQPSRSWNCRLVS